MDEVVNMYPNLSDQTYFRLSRLLKAILLLKFMKEIE